MNFKAKNFDVFLRYVRFMALVFIVCGALFLALWISPFDKPDENLHFYKAFAVSQGHFICPVENGHVVNPIPSSVHDFVEAPNKVPETKSVLTPTINEQNSCVLPFIYYLLPGLTIFVLWSMHVPITIIFFAGRLTNVCFALLILFISLKRLPIKLQLPSFFIYTLPMTLFQISSYSKDVYHIALGIFLLNKLFLFLSEKKLSDWDIGSFIFALILFILTRPQYGWFVLLLFLLPLTKSKKHHLYLMLLSFSVVVGVLLFLIHHDVYLSPFNENQSLVFHALINPQKQLLFIAKNPLSFLLTIFHSLTGFALFYVKSAIGIFGSLNEPLPNFVYAIYIFFGIVVSGILGFSKEISVFTRACGMFFLITVLSMLTLFLAMYLYGSPVGSDVVYALQGRYFILLIPLVMILVASGIAKFSQLLLLPHFRKRSIQRK